jgi:hypothetical protein
MKKRFLVLAVIGSMLSTFITAPPAHAIVPAFAWFVWGIGAAVSGVAVVVDVGNQEEQHGQEQHEAGNPRGQEEIKPEGSEVQAGESGG